MDLSTRLSLSILILCTLLACKSSAGKKNEVSKVPRLVDTGCDLSFTNGRRLAAKLSCTNCHNTWDQAPRLRKDIPLFKEISVMDSTRLRNFVFKGRHNGMFITDYPDAGKILDSLTACDKNNLIHYIKNYNKPEVKTHSNN